MGTNRETPENASALDVITKEQLDALRDAGFVVVHRIPTEGMKKAGYSAFGIIIEGSVKRAYHRMVAESIRLQNAATPSNAQKEGCGKALKAGQWYKYCGETDMGQTMPALCEQCGGEFKLEEE